MADDLTATVVRDFAFLHDEVAGVLVFGSAVDPTAAPRDIDVCLVAPEVQASKLLLRVFDHVDVRGKRYDVWVFEELAIAVRAEILRSHRIAASKDVPALTEYLYFQGKVCRDLDFRRRKAG